MYRVAKGVVAANAGLVVVGIATFAVLWGLLLSHRAADFLSSGVVTWWTGLCAVSVLNVCGWRRCATLARKTAGEPLQAFQRWQLLLSAVFVLGCGFRSILPRADVQRIGLIDSWLSCVLVGRSVATLAELCFVAQWALLLYFIASEARSRLGMGIAWVLVPIIVVAELCSWYAVLTTCYLGNVLEESLWAVSAALLLVGCLALWRRCRPALRPLVAVALLVGGAYLAFLCTVDIPMYVSRWLADEASGRVYLSLGQGAHDAWARRVVTFDWEQWRTEVPWMTLYFSVGVWSSIGLVHAPVRIRADQMRS